MKILIVSAVGTSLLTNHADEQTRRLLAKTANLNENEIPKEELDLLRRWVEEVQELMKDAQPTLWRERSAEVNGILSYLDERKDANVHHVLVATDTWQGKTAAAMVEDFLRKSCNHTVEVLTFERLSTKSTYDFNQGMAHFVKWCQGTLPDYKKKSWHVVFNVTGGFKSVQSYLTILGMLYADEIVYTFEPPAGGLITIPRLPMRLDAEDVCRQNAVALEILRNCQQMRKADLGQCDLPDLFLEEVPIDDTPYVSLSVWGRAVWGEYRKDILSEKLLEWPRLEYANTFKRDWEDICEKNDRFSIQEALAKASAILVESNGDIAKLKTDGGLQYEEYKDRKGIAHFRISKGTRVSCTKSNGGLRLRRVGAHDYVNRDP